METGGGTDKGRKLLMMWFWKSDFAISVKVKYGYFGLNYVDNSKCDKTIQLAFVLVHSDLD